MKIQKSISFLLVLILTLSLSVQAFAFSDKDLDDAVTDTAKFMYKTVENPQVGSIGGEWAVLGLVRSGYEVPEEYYQNYYETVETYVKDCKGVLHNKKYTEYSRLIIALTAIGKNPTDVAGYNLLTPLGDYDKTIWQGMNGPIWALIALDSGNYDMPINKTAKTQATREMYIQRILDCQLADGGWSLFGGISTEASGDGKSDTDITGMALQALAKYQDRADVKKATNEALDCMSKQQDNNAGFSSWNSGNSESCAQMIVALTEFGISLDDPRFVKNGKTMLDNLMTYYVPENGFKHTGNGSGSNQMAAEQGFYGIVAAQRAKDGKPSLYRMTDAISIGEGQGGSSKGEGLPNKHKDIKRMPVINAGKTFSDITGDVFCPNQTAIEALASRGIINGKTEQLYVPDVSMTRAEFAAVVVRGLGLPQTTTDQFVDVNEMDWFANVVGTAYRYGIVNGVDVNHFNPHGIISRQEAAVMVARAAKLCGMKTDMTADAVRDMLAQFTDYVTTSDWARPYLAFCYSEEILSQQDLDIRPNVAISRGEVAEMLYNLLGSAKLL